jgi:low affinity Fe/Cu permease
MTAFDRFAEAASRFVSRAWFFLACVVLVLIWLPSLPLFGTIDTWQLVINTATTIVTFLLVALLQNSQWRSAEATNRKLDATADGLADTMESLILVMERLGVEETEHELLRHARELRETVGIEKSISSSGHDERKARAPAGAVGD